jgi:hypothetical protein
VTATKVKLPGGTELVAEKILIVKDRAGNPGNLISFTNGVILGLSKTPGSKFIVVQMYESNGRMLKEKLRFIVSVSD